MFLRRAACDVSVLWLTSCLTPVEPTPVSAVATIVSVSPTASGSELPNASFFATDIKITNSSTTRIFVATPPPFVEKLVNQKWTFAYAASAGTLGSALPIDPSGSLTLRFSVSYVKGSSPAYPLVEHVRGLYRVHYRLA